MRSASRWSVAGAVLVAVYFSPAAVAEAAEPGDEPRVPWTSSRVIGSPDPPSPLTTRQVYPRLQLDRPTEMIRVPGTDRWIVTQLVEPIVSFRRAGQGDDVRVALDLPAVAGELDRTLGIVFHPRYPAVPYCYVTYSVKAKSETGTRLARFHVSETDTPILDPDSQTILAGWRNHGHCGGCLKFGPDGFLYVTIGDGQPPNPPDPLNTGQDLSDLQSAILRIDVNAAADGKPYGIPADNPFVNQPGARPEIWAYGFRNPWKMAFDPASHTLWTGDVGWEMREMVYRVDRGANYGWSVMEGSQVVKPNATRGTEPISRPIVEHTHVEARSVTGGYFYYGSELPQLSQAYLYGDYMTGKIWGLKHDGSQVTWHQELADTPLQIICFALDSDGEVLVVGYDGTVHRLIKNAVVANQAPFPRRLSQTGLFEDVAAQRPAAGVLPYQINASYWADGTTAQRWIAIPGRQRLVTHAADRWEVGQVQGEFDFPDGSVMVRTVSYQQRRGDSTSSRKLETQLLHRSGDSWQAYNYIWNDEQTDADLQENVSIERELSILDQDAPGGVRKQLWHHASRNECLLCHIWRAGTVLGFRWDQLVGRDSTAGGKAELSTVQLRTLIAEPVPQSVRPISSPYDAQRDLEPRARAYLHLNCSSCHRRGGGGTATFSAVRKLSLTQTNLIDAPPTQGNFGLTDARIIAAGQPTRSVLLLRLAKLGRGHMPQFGTNEIDAAGVRLIHDWIENLEPGSPRESVKRSVDLEWLAKADQLSGADLKKRITGSLSTTESAFQFALACGEASLPQATVLRIADQASRHPDSVVRDLFERFLPYERRLKRLGPDFELNTVLELAGDVSRGQRLFESAAGVTCRHCHQIGAVGKPIGPSLGNIGLLLTPPELLGSIVRPSLKVAKPYQTTVIATTEGRVVTGMIVEETPEAVQLADLEGKIITLARREIEARQASPKSIMPERLLAQFSAQQAADLLAYLSQQQTAREGEHRRYRIRRAESKLKIDGKLDEPDWSSAPSVGAFSFTWWAEGDGPRQPTDARMLWDDEYLYVSFVCRDSDVRASRTERDSQVYLDDCVEVFAAPDPLQPRQYFNLEINALGTRLDNYRPRGEKPQSAWNPDGIKIAVEVNGKLNDAAEADQGWTVEVAIPFRLFPEVPQPQMGTTWRLNLHRLENDKNALSQWSRGDVNRQSFHVPEYFGIVTFE